MSIELNSDGGVTISGTEKKAEEFWISMPLPSNPEKRIEQVMGDLAKRVGQEILIFDSRHKRWFEGIVRYNSKDPEKRYKLEVAPHTHYSLDYSNVASILYLQRKG